MSAIPMDIPDLVEPENMRLLRIPLKYLDHYPDNVREDYQLDSAFCKSLVTEQQVILTVIPIPDDHEHQEGEEEFLFWVVKGNRRLAGGRKVQLEDMLCLVDMTKIGDKAALLIDQVVENDGHLRRPLSPFEEAKALFQAHRAGAKRADIRRRTGRSRRQVADGIQAGRLSEQTTRAAQAMDYDWTVSELALLDVFDGNQRALDMVERLVHSRYPAAHAVEKVRESLQEEAAHKKIVTELAQAGVTVTKNAPAGSVALRSLSYLVDDFNAEAHPSCPGHGAFFYDYDLARPQYYCTTPDKHGYTPSTPVLSSPGGAGPSSQPKKPSGPSRKIVIEGRKAWPRVGTVRQQWLAEFFQRKTAPKCVLPFVTQTLLTMPGPVRQYLTAAPRSSLYAKFGGPADPVKALEGASPGKMAMLLLRLIAVAFEHEMTAASGDCKNTWRPDMYSPCSTQDAALWLRFVVTTLGAELGTRAYPPAPIEQALLDGKPYVGDIPAGQAVVTATGDPNEVAVEDTGDGPGADVEAGGPDEVALGDRAEDDGEDDSVGPRVVGPYSSDDIDQLIAEFAVSADEGDGEGEGDAVAYPEAA